MEIEQVDYCFYKLPSDARLINLIVRNFPRSCWFVEDYDYRGSPRWRDIVEPHRVRKDHVFVNIKDWLARTPGSSVAEFVRKLEGEGHQFKGRPKSSVKPVEGVQPVAPDNGPLLPKMPLPPHLQGRVRREGEDEK